MQKTLTLLLALCGQTYTMDPTTPRLRRDTNHAIAPEERGRMEVDKVEKTSNVMIAAWVVTPETQLDVFDEIIIQKHQNGMYSIKHFSRPKGMRETPCDLKSVLQVTIPSSSTVRAMFLQHAPDNLELALPQEESWYKHPVATHGAAILSTMLLMAALFH